MEKILIFLDTSGSTHNKLKYFQNASQIENDIRSRNFEIIYHEWAVNCVQLNKESFDKCINSKKNEKCDANGTQTSSIIPYLDQDLKNVNSIYIITDGQISKSESILTNSSLSNLITKNQSHFPKIELRIFNTGYSKVDDSVVLPFTQHGNINIEVDGSSYASIEKFERTIENITKFIQEININQLTVDQVYKNKIQSQLRAMTFLSDNKEYILEANNAISKLKLAQLKQSDLDQLPEMILSSNQNISEIINYINTFPSGNVSNLEQEASRLNTIVNSYRDTKTLIFNKNIVGTQPEPIVIESASLAADYNNNSKSAGFIECPITFEIGTPYLVCNKRISAILNDLKKDILSQITVNPLLIINFCRNELENLFGSYFCFSPDQINFIDPRTRNDFKDDDGTVLVLTLGTTSDHIKYTNSILFRLFANDFKICDPDFIFMSIWYHLKYFSKKDYLKELIPAFESQLKERFNKMSFLSLNSNTFENLNRAKKFCCIWYVIHELPYLKQHDQSHSSIRRYLSTVDYMLTFLEDIFQVKVSNEIKNYLKMYHQMLQLRKFKNTTDQSEFWRIIAALKHDYIRLDTRNSKIQLSKDNLVNKIESVSNFDDDTRSNDLVEINRKAYLVTIPIDIAPGKVQIKKKYDELVKDFPDSLKHLKPDEIIHLALLTYKTGELYFNDEARNNMIINESIKSLGFDPFDSSQNWPYYEPLKVALDPKTLRPFKYVNGTTWHTEARKLIGSNKRFISYYKHIADFVLEHGKIPNLNEYILFIYKKEIEGKIIEITFKSEFNGTYGQDLYFNKCIRLNVSKLQEWTMEKAKEVLDQFTQTTNGLKLEDIIERLNSNQDNYFKKNYSYYFGEMN